MCFPAVNLAVALAVECRLRVGLLDADVYGPSIPSLMKLQGRPQLDSGLLLHLTLKSNFFQVSVELFQVLKSA